jgi:hypothetical protein
VVCAEERQTCYLAASNTLVRGRVGGFSDGHAPAVELPWGEPGKDLVSGEAARIGTDEILGQGGLEVRELQEAAERDGLEVGRVAA